MIDFDLTPVVQISIERQIPSADPDVITTETTDITENITEYLTNISVELYDGNKADALDIELIDPEGRLIPPQLNETIVVEMGYQSPSVIGAISAGFNNIPNRTTNMGRYSITSVEMSGFPQTINIQAISTPWSLYLNDVKTQSYLFNTRIIDILFEKATLYKLKPYIQPSVGEIIIGAIHQTDETDLNFINRIAQKYDLLFKVTLEARGERIDDQNVRDRVVPPYIYNGSLAITTKATGLSATGKATHLTNINRDNLLRWNYTNHGRYKYRAVRAQFLTKGLSAIIEEIRQELQNAVNQNEQESPPQPRNEDELRQLAIDAQNLIIQSRQFHQSFIEIAIPEGGEIPKTTIVPARTVTDAQGQTRDLPAGLSIEGQLATQVIPEGTPQDATPVPMVQPFFTIRSPFSDFLSAIRGCLAELVKLNRESEKFTCTIIGNQNVRAGARIFIEEQTNTGIEILGVNFSLQEDKGIKPGITGEWVITKVTHHINAETGYNTYIEATPPMSVDIPDLPLLLRLNLAIGDLNQNLIDISSQARAQAAIDRLNNNTNTETNGDT